MVGLLLQLLCLLWPWLLTPAWNTRNFLLGQELMNFGFSEDQLTPCSQDPTLRLRGGRLHLLRMEHLGKLLTLQGLRGAAGIL